MAVVFRWLFVVSFSEDSITVNDIGATDVVTATEDATLADIAQMMDDVADVIEEQSPRL